MKTQFYDSIEPYWDNWKSKEIEMAIKKWYTSKTLWVNVAIIAGMIAEYLLTSEIIQPEIHGLAVAIINLVLRKFTDTKLTK